MSKIRSTLPSLTIDPARVRALAWHLLERLEDLSSRAGELIGAVGLLALSVAVVLEGLLEVFAVLLAVVAAALLAVLPRVRAFLEDLRPRLIRWYIRRS